MKERKEEIKNKVNYLLNDILTLVEEEENKHAQLVAENISAQAQYSKTFDDTRKLIKEAEEAQAKNKKVLEEISTKEDSVNRLIVRQKEEHDEFANEVSSMKLAINRLDSEILALESKKKTLEAIVSQTEAAKKNLDSILAAVNKEDVTLRSMKEEASKVNFEASKAIADAKKEAEAIIREATATHDSIIDRAQHLYELEKTLAAKENDLKIVEARLRKMYDDKGLGFKV